MSISVAVLSTPSATATTTVSQRPLPSWIWYQDMADFAETIVG